MKNPLASLLLLMLLLGYSLQSCKKESKSSNKTEINKTPIKSEDSIKRDSEPEEDPTYNFPKT